MFKRLCVSVLLCACPLLAQADGVAPYEEYATHLRAAQEVTPLTSGEFGDQVSLYNGATEFDVVDIDVPGNNALSVQLRRRFEISDRRAQPGHLNGFGEWDLDVPYLEGVFAQPFGWMVNTPNRYDRCSNPAVPYTGDDLPVGQNGQYYGSPDEIWDGYQMHIPGRGFQDLLVSTQAQLPGVTPNPGAYPWITRDYTRVSCLPALANAAQGYPGEGFLALSPDGTKTYFDYVVVMPYSDVLVDQGWAPNPNPNGPPIPYRNYAARNKIFILASRVEDRFGNSVSYSYGSDSAGNNILTKIQSSDGRTITPTYTNGVVTGVTSNIGNWSYGYVTPPTGSGYSGKPSLHTVTRPDQSKWTYVSSGSLRSTPLPPPAPGDWIPPANHCQLDPVDVAPGTFTYAVSAPFGATATYQFNMQRHGRSYIPNSCADGNYYHHYPEVFDFIDNYTLDSKQVTGPGLAAPLTWTYAYSDGFGSKQYFDATVSGYTSPWDSQTYVPQGDCPSCKFSKQVTVTSPTEVTKYTFGVQYARNDGRLLATEIDGLDGSVLRTTANTFVADADVANLPFPSYPGTNLATSYKNPSANWIRPQSQTAIVQDGVTFTHQTNAWDVFARPTSVTRSSTLGFGKTENTTYADNTTNWVIGQVATVTDNASGLVEVENDYDPQSAMLASTRSFGVLEKTNTWYTVDDPVYHEAGALKSVTDGNNQTTTLSNWLRGVPQNVAYADGSSESAAVNDAGWITSYTDENSFTTAYGYDPMGRVNQVTYPLGDSVAWTPTTSNFVQVNSPTPEYGLAAGHWKQTVSTGASRKTVYFDALLRPVLQLEQDTSDPTTNRYTEQAFDAANRTVFASYPSATASVYNDLTLGTHNTFDGLGRPLASAQDSELVNPKTGSDQLVTSYTYQQRFMTQVTNPRGISTTTAYQAFDSPDTSHPTVIASPMSVTTTIDRDVFGKPLDITRSGTYGANAISETRSYVYDANQRLCERIEPETGATLMNYDAAGNVLWTSPGNAPTTGCTTVAPANAIMRSYDPRNRLLTETVPGSTNIAWHYYPDGELWTLTSGSGSTANVWRYTYDKRRLPVTENLTFDGRSETITHGYDARGHENSLTYPDGLVINTAPNALGQPSQAGVTSSLYAGAVSYFPNGAMSGFTYGNKIVHTLTQNTRGLPLESLDQTPDGKAILDDTYTYDQNANVIAIADGTAGNKNARTMSYDSLDRLKGTTAPGQPWVTASTVYDGLDNIRSNTLGQRTYNYAYDNTWRLSTLTNATTHANVMTLGYDASGNVASKGNGQDSYTFDVANRMQSVNGKESYQYDGYGRRVKITTAAGKIDYPIYDMTGRLLTEDDQRTNLTTDYVSLNGSLVAKRTATIGHSTWTKTYEHTDALHSPIFETDSTGALTRAERYTPFGEPSDGTYTQGPGFTGHVTDAGTGLTYAQQRYYDPVVGRFLSADPVQASDNGASFNRYWYANNNPYKFADVDGRSALGAVGNFVADALNTVSEDLMELPPEPAMLAVPEMEEAAVELRELSADTQVAEDSKAIGSANCCAPEIPKPTTPDAAGEAATADSVHLNSTASNAPNHRYEIVDSKTGEVQKTGISGRPLNANGTSPRANQQVNRLNSAAGSQKYHAVIKETAIPGRKAALEAERKATEALKAQGHALPMQSRPSG